MAYTLRFASLARVAVELPTLCARPYILTVSTISNPWKRKDHTIGQKVTLKLEHRDGDLLLEEEILFYESLAICLKSGRCTGRARKTTTSI